VPGVGTEGALRIRIGGTDRAPAHTDETALRVLSQGSGLAIQLPIAADRLGTLAPGMLRFAGDRGTVDLPATFEGSVGVVVVRLGAGGHALPRGRYGLTAHLGSEKAPGLPAGSVVVRDDGRFAMIGVRGMSRLARLRAWTSWTQRSARDRVRTRALATFRRMPAGAKDLIRTAYGRRRG
jgi:hypothetical protein